MATVFALFQKSAETDYILDRVVNLDEDDATDFRRIRCPLCDWQPCSSSRWYCGDCDYPEYFYGACGTLWNTFSTRGMCPGCAHQWHWTSCLRCEGWSPHENWYASDAD
ncbi:MAG: hypothetical protein MSG64_18645 [Pyrinomonadaceae bacterium MAG19_C2-C3]|nr:hypothetical protein [Pyrinomonadaceae bacterium MAG19_C2-C3]